ncbi:MAG: UDP-glucose--hexose-1-phosphate uridylyltransferase [Pseudoalteromonas distincta]|jgi:UDPglucose--hexose-1-phosphate uridylyltransferase|uniref:UDP-glucose--hexose-1-phosphate uridylyltransferase n=1 Tax=unclassified Pseudoalteromonas TaxID=194690 RepID=UPI0003F8C9A5|nr:MULTISPECIES: UDP-glucose--hexose-1-phosphate uridylyltransferase [unclassified Pseudoalteromonas]
MALLESTHRRKNPLTGRWVLVSPHRNNRPWLGATEAVNESVLPKHDESCPLCPGNTRANGDSNPDYEYTHVFKNDFGALTPNASDQSQSLESDSDLFIADEASGECRVICFSPEHNKTLPELELDALYEVVKTWKENYTELAQHYECVHVFENKGEIMGCSQPHPHGQIWAHSHSSTEIEAEDTQQLAYYKKHGSAMLADYVQKEQTDKTRVVFENAHWLVVVPFWAAWPFETILLTKDNIQNFSQLNDIQINTLAQAIKVLTTKYDNIFNCSFPYSMGWHNAPANRDSDEQHWRLHAHFYPPLLRSSTVKKHMVGYEMLGESQRDLSAETAASILKATTTKHYKHTAGNTDDA